MFVKHIYMFLYPKFTKISFFLKLSELKEEDIPMV
jgi:hypothetical protein